MTTACARVESIDQFGNRKVGWFMASSFDWGDDRASRVVSVKGLGMHRVGNTWSLGAQKIQVVSISSDCQLVVFNQKEKITSALFPVRPDEICLHANQ